MAHDICRSHCDFPARYGAKSGKSPGRYCEGIIFFAEEIVVRCSLLTCTCDVKDNSKKNLGNIPA